MFVSGVEEKPGNWAVSHGSFIIGPRFAALPNNPRLSLLLVSKK